MKRIATKLSVPNGVIWKICLFLLCISLCVSFPCSAQQKGKYKLVFHWETSAGRQNIVNWPYRPNGYFQWLVKNHTGDRIEFETREKLYGASESVLAVGDGRVDMGNQIVAYSSGTYPLFDFGALPGLFSIGPEGATEWANSLLDPDMKRILARYARKANLVFLGANTSTAQQTVWAHREVAKVEDFKGLKLRASGLIQTVTLSSLGASPLTLATGEVFEALRRKTVDGIVTSLLFGIEIGLMDVCAYASTWPITPIFGSMVVMNARKFDALPRDLQEGLLKAGEGLTKAGPAMVENLYYTYPRWLESVRKTTLVTVPDEELKKAARMWAPAIRKWLEVSGPEGKEVLKIALKYANGPSKPVVAKILQE